MKKIIKWIVLIALIVSIALLSACAKKSFKVIFDSNGGSAVASVETDGKSKFVLPTPTKDGYEFVAWYYDDETFREEFTVGSLIASGITFDIKVYAKWTEILVSTEGLECEKLEDGSYTVTGYAGTAERVVVAEHKDADITAISEEAFLNNTSIKRVAIADTVKSIGAAAFKGCTEITDITLPFAGSSRQSNMSEDGVFGHIFGSSDSYDIFESPTQQFFGANHSRYYYIPQKLNRIEITDASFIAYGAFYGCKYIKNIELNEGISAIKSRAFENCSALKGIYLSAEISEVGSLVFGGSVSLKIYCAAQDKPSGWENNWNVDNAPVHWGVQKNAFGQNESYQYIIENNAISITGYVGDELKNEMPYHIENKPVERIKSFAFSGSSIYELKISDSVTHIAASSFSGAAMLNTLDLPFLGETIFSAEKSFIGYLFGAMDSLTNKARTPSSLRKVSLSGGMLADNAFNGCDRLTEITLPPQLKAIGEGTFRGCERLVKADVPNGVTTIGKNAFASCKALEDFRLPNSLVGIGEEAFHGCSSLKEVKIPQGVKTIPTGAFRGCSSLVDLQFYDSLTEIGDSAFEDCTSLKSFILPAELNNIGQQAFRGCLSLLSAAIPDKTQLIHTKAFENCSAMTTIYIPNSVITIGVHTFKGCSALTIYAGAATKPGGWLEQWNIDGRTVIWNYDLST